MGGTERLAQPFIVPEYKRLVFAERSTGCTTKLIAAERRLHRVKIVPGIQSAVTQEFVTGTVEGVAAAAGRSIDDSTG